MRRALLVLPILILLGCKTVTQRDQSGPWDIQSLNAPPVAAWGAPTNGTNCSIQEVYYEGEAFRGKPTRVFAYVARPEGSGPFPAVVLVHGGGGKAFSGWAEHWAQRGYVAIAMDTAGAGPNGPLVDGGPDQSDTTKFRNFTVTEIPDMWTYHAVAAVIRAHSLIRSLPEVDPNRTALTGISWGGYLTCIVAGVDHRFKAAVPVYGCGFLGENSVWKNGSLANMNAGSRKLWLKTFDPSRYLSRVSCPILFFNGTHDFAYPLDSYQKSYHLVKPSLRHLSVVMKLPHGHIWTFNEPDHFINAALRHEPFPRINSLKLNGDSIVARSSVQLREAQLNYTVDTGPWGKRVWNTISAQVDLKHVHVKFPATNENLTLLLTATTANGLRISSEYWQRGGRPGEASTSPGASK